MIGDFLYGITASEALSQPVHQRRLAQSSFSSASASVSVSLDVPGDKVGLLTNLCIQGDGGGGQTITELNLIARDELGNTIAVLAQDRNVSDALNWQGFVVLMPNERIVANAQFSAGVAANSVSLNAHLLLVPKGNVQLR